jgi:hypothetical protein
MSIVLVRVAGGPKTDPRLDLLKDGQLVPDPEGKLQIAGREDVLPAIQRGIAKARELFNVELHPAGRNTWNSEAVVKQTKPKVEKPKTVTPIDKQQLKQKLQGRAVIPDSAVARSTPDQSA